MKDLNPQQKTAVTTGDGPVLVLAGPGSGKTRVLTRRIAYIISYLGITPQEILAVTFTNKAAKSLEARLQEILHEKPREMWSNMWLGTFHSICARILRREANDEENKLPFDRNFVIFDDDDQLDLVKNIVKNQNLDDKKYKPRGVLSQISSAKNENIFPGEYVKWAEKRASKNDERFDSYKTSKIAQIYKEYQGLLREYNAVDFDDLLLWVSRLLSERPIIKEKYSKRFKYVLVDEFQDTNLVQYEIVRQLSSYHSNIFVVGDEDQSIYRWRGADYRNVMRFEEDYPKAQKILLEQNYRSTQTVLDAAVSVINRNQHRTPKRLRSLPDHGRGDPIIFCEAADDKAEAAYVVATIEKIAKMKQYRTGDVAVMYRTNAQSRLLEEAFMHAGMAYRLVGAQRFYGRREIKDLISFLRLVQNPADEVSLRRVINVPPRGIGDKTVDTLLREAQEAGVSASEILLDLGRQRKESLYWEKMARGAASLADFGALLVGWRDRIESMSIPELFDRILEDTVYYEHVSDGTEEGRSRWENVQELRSLANEYEDIGLSSFLENLALVSDQDTVTEEAEAPTLLTLHAAKGLEFPVVFIVGLDEGLLPHSRALDDPEEMAEERRLFYVGLTRAKNKIVLVRAHSSSTYGSQGEPSRFLADISKELLKSEVYPVGGSASLKKRANNYDTNSSYNWDRTSSSSSHNQPGNRALRTFKSPPPPSSAPILQVRYHPAMRVSHPSWGEGLVLESRIQDGDETVDVEFASVGFKRLVASLANLEILPGKEK